MVRSKCEVTYWILRDRADSRSKKWRWTRLRVEFLDVCGYWQNYKRKIVFASASMVRKKFGLPQNEHIYKMKNCVYE